MTQYGVLHKAVSSVTHFKQAEKLIKSGVSALRKI